MTDHNLIWAIAGCVIGLVGYCFGWMSYPKFRKGCNECDAAIRRAAEEQVALRHETAHKGFSFKNGDPDQFDCADEHCNRNKHDGR